MKQFQDLQPFIAVEDKNTNIIKKYVQVIYKHLFSGMHQILHLKLDNIIQGTKSGITHVKIKTKSLPGQMHKGLAKKVCPFSQVFPYQEKQGSDFNRDH